MGEAKKVEFFTIPSTFHGDEKSFKGYVAKDNHEDGYLVKLLTDCTIEGKKYKKDQTVIVGHDRIQNLQMSI